MRSKMILLAAVVLAPVTVVAVPNVGGCGLGSKLFAGQSGIAPQVLAITTNGSFGSQTFGVSTGTSGCTQDGVVKSNWQTAMFIDENATKLAKDVAVGEGETLDSLAGLLGMQQDDRAVFFAHSKANFDRIFPNENTSSEHVVVTIRRLLTEHPQLVEYAKQI